MREQLLLRERHEDGVVVLTVSGELDIVTGTQLDARLAGLSAAGHHRVALDASGLTFCDAYGVRALTRACVRARTQAGWLRLVGVRPRVRRTLTLLALAELLPMFDTLAAALGDQDFAAAPTGATATGT